MRSETRDQKLVIAVVQRDDAEPLQRALKEQGYGTIVLSSTGGFLRRGNATLLTITSSQAVDSVIAIIRDTASERTEVRDPGINLQISEWYLPQSVSVHTGGASIWVLDADLAGFLPSTTGTGSRPGKH
ncbi:MAG: cyclic-di-AMP receptor [Chloroflexota bacterium]|nr:cyclic-di-AMP receptor [Chloroflexota bacterium]